MGQVSCKELNEDDMKYIKQNTKFDENDIKNWWKTFQTDCVDGKMTPEQLRRICEMVWPEFEMEELANHLMRAFDTDDDGFVDFKEFMVGINTTAYGTEKEKIQNVFRMYDIDGNKVVELHEIIKIMKASYKALIPCIEDSTFISKEAKMTFDAMDKNKDQKVTEEEFLECMSNQTK